MEEILYDKEMNLRGNTSTKIYSSMDIYLRY